MSLHVHLLCRRSRTPFPSAFHSALPLFPLKCVFQDVRLPTCVLLHHCDASLSSKEFCLCVTSKSPVSSWPLFPLADLACYRASSAWFRHCGVFLSCGTCCVHLASKRSALQLVYCSIRLSLLGHLLYRLFLCDDVCPKSVLGRSWLFRSSLSAKCLQNSIYMYYFLSLFKLSPVGGPKIAFISKYTA